MTMRIIRKVILERGDAVWTALDANKNKAVAEQLGVHPVDVAQWKRGILAVQWDQYVKLCEYLGVKHD